MVAFLKITIKHIIMKKGLLFAFVVMLLVPTWLHSQSTCTPPTNLVAVPHAPQWRNVQFDWLAPVDTTEQIIRWSTTYATRIGGGDGVAMDFKGFARFDTADLAGLGGRMLAAVSFVPGELQTVCTYYIEVYKGGSMTFNPSDTILNLGTLVLNQQVTVPLTLNVVNTVMLDSVISVDPSEELWIAIRCNTTTGHPLGASNNTVVPFKADIIAMRNSNGNWGYGRLGNVGVPGYNWLIEGVLKDPDHVLRGYKLYRNQALQTPTPIPAPNYMDTLYVNGTYTYDVTALYTNGCESSAITKTVTMTDNPCVNCSDSLVVGTGTSTTSYVPTYPYYFYSYTQQIYTASEISAVNGYIPCISFQYINANPVTRNLKVYMGNTEKNTFASNTDWIGLDDLVLVYEGPIYFSTQYAINNWVNIPLTTPFEWDGISNIVVAVQDETGVRNSSGAYFNVHSMSSKTLYSYRDTGPYDLTTALPSGTLGSIRDNIRFMIGDPITCFMPTHLLLSDLTSSTVTVSWTPHAGGNDFDLVLVSDSDDFNNVSPITVTDTFYTFTNLSEKTGYRIYLRANCGIDGYSSWVQRSFKTPCVTSDVLPYEEDFENAGTGTMAFPECWNKITSNGTYPYIKMAPDSTNALYFYTTSITYNTAVMPPLDLSQATSPVALSFKAMKTSAAYGRVDVGYMTNPNDISTFTILKSIYPSDYVNLSSWYSFMIPLTNVAANPLYLAFMVPTGGSTSYLYIDDVRVGEMVGCSSPSALTVSSIAGASAMLSWQAAPYGVTDYVLEYEETGTGNLQFSVITGTQTMLTGLSPETNYTVYVYSDCVDGSTDTLIETFTTGCLAGGETAVGSGTTTNYLFPLNNYYNYSYTQQIYLASEMGGPHDITSVSFDYAYTTSMTAKTNVNIYLGHTTQSAFTSTSNYVPLANLQLVYSGSLNCQQGWNTFVLDSIFHYNGTDNLVLAVDDNSGSYNSNTYTFHVHSAGAYRSLYYYSDSANPDPNNPTSAGASSSYTNGNRNNVKFGSPCDSLASCIAPNVFVTDISDVAATVAWVPGSSEDTWEFEYKSETDTAWTSMGQVTTSPIQLTGLTSDMMYYIRMRSFCSGTDTSNWAVVTAHTICMITSLPYEENFSHATGSGSTHTVPCWTKGTNSSTAYPYPSSSYSQSAPYSLYFYGTSAYYSYAAAPRLADNIPLDSLFVQFYAYKTSANYFIEYGMMSNPNDISTFEPIGRFSPANVSDWELYEFTTENYTGTGRYLAFRVPQWVTDYMYLDDIRIDYLPHCAHVRNIEVSGISNSEATITWQAGDVEQVWAYVYGLADSVDLTQETPVDIYTNHLDLQGLLSNTAYDVYVFASCDDGYYSNAVKISFSTLCDPINTLPYSQNFDSIPGTTSGTGINNLPDCWTNLNIGSNSSYRAYPIVYNSSSLAQSSPNSIRFYTYTASTMSDQYAIMPAFDSTLYPIYNLMLSFDARKYSSSYASFNLVVGVMSDVTDASTFVPVDTVTITDITYNHYSVLFLNTNFAGGHIALMAPQFTTVTYNSGYVDNLVLEVKPACLYPVNFTYLSSTDNSVTLKWETIDNETAWNVAYGPHGFNPDSPGSGGNIIPASTSTFTVNNLTLATEYDFYVQSDCGSDGNSVWVGPVTASTAMCQASDQCEYRFVCYDGYGDGWNGGYIIVKQNGTTVTNVEALDHGSTPSVDTIRVMLCDNMSTTLTWVEGDYDEEVSVTVLDRVGNVIYSQSDMSMITSNLLITTTTDCNAAPPTPPTPPTPDPCNTPTGLTATDITKTSVKLDWAQTGSNVSNWTINYKADGVSVWSTMTASSHPFTLTGLEQQTNYSAYVVANCTEGTSDPSNTISFRTAGDGIADYEQSISLYPNPNSGRFIINNEQLIINNVQVYDVYGKLLKTVEVDANTIELDVRELASGMYFVRISTEKGVVIKSFVKK